MKDQTIALVYKRSIRFSLIIGIKKVFAGLFRSSDSFSDMFRKALAEGIHDAMNVK